MNKKFWLLIPVLSSIVILALDQWVKYWARTWLQPVGEKPLINGLLGFTYVENRGAAFGMMQGARWLLIPLTVVVLAGIAVYYVKLPYDRATVPVRVPLILILAGALGNFIDRLKDGYVVDMFEFKFISFPVFNVADICLVCGTILLAFVMLFIWKPEQS